ncbi:MAG: alpha/beta hydrolase, partial [Gammaproteobacteria bacterium]
MKRIIIGVIVALVWGSAVTAATPQQAASPLLIRVTLGGTITQAESGRLLLFAIPKAVADAQAKAKAKDGKVTSVDTSPFRPEEVAVAAQEVQHLMPGGSVVVDADSMAFPKAFSQLQPGTYDVQAVLDVNHDYNYRGRGTGDILSDVATVQLGGKTDAIPNLNLTQVEGARFQPWQAPPNGPKEGREKFVKALAGAHANAQEIDFVSPALSAFWGRPIHMRGWVLTPPGYAAHKDEHYPTVYMTHGFGGNVDTLTFSATDVWSKMSDGETPPMIWVLLDESSATGTHEFADSVNNGPWGTALTTELIPYLESNYRMDARSSGRFLTGHSSGGWAT